jgi:predicted MFS family arabinose efflux permease
MSAPASRLTSIPAIRALLGLGVLGFGGFFLTLSSVPLWLVSRGGTPEALAGLAVTVMLGTTVLTQLFVPALVARFGQRAVLLASMLTLGLPAPLMLLAPGLALTLPLAAVRGTGFAGMTVLMPLIATQVAPAGRQGSVIGLYGLAIAIPNLITVPAAVALTSSGHFAVVAVLAALPVLAIPLVRRLPRDPAVVPAHMVSAAGPHRSLVPSTFVLATVTLTGGGILALLPVALPTGTLATVALLVFGLTGAMARWRVGVLADRLPLRPLLLTGIGVGVIGLLLLAAGAAGTGGTRYALVCVGAALFGTGYGAVQNLTLLTAFDAAGPARRSTASAVWNAAFDAGTALGALLLGAAVTGFGLPIGVLLAAALVLAALPVAVSATRTGR